MKHASIAFALVAIVLLTGCTHSQVPTATTPGLQDEATPLATIVQAVQSSLPQAIEDWIGLLEQDRLADASSRWAKDQEAAQQIARWWESLRECNQQYDYRNWVKQAEQAPHATTFKIGGHDYGFMHTDWEKTPDGWRVVSVYICR